MALTSRATQYVLVFHSCSSAQSTLRGRRLNGPVARGRPKDAARLAHRELRAAGVARPRIAVSVALDAKVILTPPCIFH